jgi:hypothetical protein
LWGLLSFSFNKAIPEKKWRVLLLSKIRTDHLKTNPWEGNTMKSKIIAFVIGTLVCTLSAPAMLQSSKDWVDIKDPKELRALYSNKTFRHTYMGVPIAEHYRADGKGIIISVELRIPCTWEVKGNDQVCVSDEKGTNCCRFQRHKKNRDEYVQRCTRDASMHILKVEDGIPEF